MAILSYQGHVLMEDRSGLVVSAVVTHADGKGERAAALAMLDAMPHVRAKSVGADKAHDQPDFVRALRERGIAPHVASNVTNICGTSIDGRTTRHQTYRASQMIVRKREEHFGWGKTIGRIRQTLYRGIRRVDQHFKLTMTASNAMAPLRGRKKSFLRQSDPPQTKIHPTNPLEVPYFNSLLGRFRHA
jgi:hypothetical protein